MAEKMDESNDTIDDNASDMSEEYQVVTRIEDITEKDDIYLAGATREHRNDLTVLIPENPFPEIAVESYPPLKFSWVVPNKLAAMAQPRNKENLQFLVNQGIDHLITLAAGKKPPVDDVPRLRWTEIPIEEFDAPTVEQMDKFIECCKRADKNGETIGIHCRQGRGRCGVMLCCYLIHFLRFRPDQALTVIRMLRPGSCDFPEQEEAVVKYYEHLTEDNPLRYGVDCQVFDQVIEAAKESNKKVLNDS